jgi:hypothetical protein
MGDRRIASAERVECEPDLSKCEEAAKNQAIFKKM